MGGENSEILSYGKENAVSVDSGEYNSGGSFGNHGGELYLFQ
jgi:hypothetical protein